MNNRRNLIFFAIFFIIYEFNAYISNDMIMPGMIKVVTEFNSPVENIAKSLSLFIIGGSTLQIFLGPLCDRYGKRNILLIGNVFFLIASGVIPFVLNIDQFLAARFFQGFGLCFIFIGYAMIHESFDDKSAVKLCSLVSNISIFAPLVGPVIGSAIILAANWRYVFIVTAVLAITSLIGLAKNMPNNKPSRKAMTLKEILQTYLKIIRTRPLLQGGLIIAVSSLPLITWIGLAPILVMQTMGKSFSYYIIYQTLVFGGFIVSSISIQFMAGRISFYKLITRGSLIAVLGLVISLIFSSIHIVFILGLFLASFGIGIFNGSIFRIAITSTEQSNSMSAATLNIIQSTVLAGGLEVLNILCSKFGYSLFGFALLNLGSGIILLLLCLNFAKLVKLRAWQ